MDRKRVFSGIQPSGNLHIGNYIGAVKHWVAGQNDGFNIFCIVDMHAITVPQDPKILNDKTLEIAAILIAAGINPDKSILFVQSQNLDHANLGWIMNCNLTIGQLKRMTQFKDKAGLTGMNFSDSIKDAQGNLAGVGLFDYPALMAADILLYDTTHVPVGEDQKQHIELARDLAEKFNSKFGETFTLPVPMIPKVGGRVMSLIDPTKKMSKSDPNKNSTIYLLDSESEVNKKIMGATTDSGNEIKKSPDKPGISNLIDIFSEFSGQTLEEVEARFVNKSYGDFKTEVSIQVNTFLNGFQEKYNKLRESSNLKDILKVGAEKAKVISHKKLQEVYEKVGFVN